MTGGGPPPVTAQDPVIDGSSMLIVHYRLAVVCGYKAQRGRADRMGEAAVGVSNGGDPSGVTRSLEEVAGLLRRTGGGQAVDGSGEVAEVRGIGTAGADRVRVEVSAFGRLEVLTIDPVLLRAGTTAIAEYVLEAVRTAQDDAQRQSSELLGSLPALDPAALSSTLDEVTIQATRGFDKMIFGLDAALRQLDRR